MSSSRSTCRSQLLCQNLLPRFTKYQANENMALRGLVWVNWWAKVPETLVDTGSSAYSMLLKLGMMFEWQIQRSGSGGCGMHMRSVVFVRYIRCTVSLVIRRRESSLLYGAQKKRMWGLRLHSLGLVRSQNASSSRSVQCRQPYLYRVRSATRALPQLWPSEARASGVPGRHPFFIPSALLSMSGGAAGVPRSRMLPRCWIWIGMRSRNSKCSTCVSSSPRQVRQDPRLML